jgi:hypothetical protein
MGLNVMPDESFLRSARPNEAYYRGYLKEMWISASPKTQIYSELSLSELAGIFKIIGIKGVFTAGGLSACCIQFSK